MTDILPTASSLARSSLPICASPRSESRSESALSRNNNTDCGAIFKGFYLWEAEECVKVSRKESLS